MSMENGDVETRPSRRKTSVSKTKTAKDVNVRQRKAQRAAILLKQASDPTRLQIILTLSGGEKHVGALCEELNQTQPAVSHHLALLRHGGLIAPRRQGKNNYYSLTDSGSELAKVVRGIVS
jgi:DNA-binding transcriptional ArsR family regulator